MEISEEELLFLAIAGAAGKCNFWKDMDDKEKAWHYQQLLDLVANAESIKDIPESGGGRSMAGKPNIRSIRFSDELAELIDRQVGVPLRRSLRILSLGAFGNCRETRRN